MMRFFVVQRRYRPDLRADLGESMKTALTRTCDYNTRFVSCKADFTALISRVLLSSAIIRTVYENYSLGR